MKIEILRDKCISSGNCVEIAGHTFAQSDDDAKVILINGADTVSPQIREAASLCPVGAIIIDGDLP
jgi:ferredoxin